MESADIKDVKRFWKKSPLFVGESRFRPGTEEFFKEHTRIVIEDCFAGHMDEVIFPSPAARRDIPILDAGCGIGFWLEQFAARGFTNVLGLDISNTAIDLAKERMEHRGFRYRLVEGNLEKLPFDDGTFSHVNCQGVVHHTPNPQAAIAEIARVLAPGGTANISVYYDNVFIRNFDRLRPLIHLVGRWNPGLNGRGRESILFSESATELVRRYDGEENPIGISFSRNQFLSLLEQHFHVTSTFLHFFPRRVFRWVPRYLHRFLDRKVGFMIYGSLVKRPTEEEAST